jgi:hypothetical protein
MMMENNNAAKPKSHVATVFVYGHGSGDKPFYKEARTKKLESGHWSLLLNTAVTCGQKLLLMEGSDPNPLQVEVVRTRLVDTQMFEAEITLTR